jgi:hypothetical protein
MLIWGDQERSSPDLLASWLALGQLHGTSYGTPMEPAIGVDAECLTGILFELSGTMYGFEEREKTFREVSA